MVERTSALIMALSILVIVSNRISPARIRIMAVKSMDLHIRWFEISYQYILKKNILKNSVKYRICSMMARARIAE
jgi:hypothetical protein